MAGPFPPGESLYNPRWLMAWGNWRILGSGPSILVAPRQIALSSSCRGVLSQDVGKWDPIYLKMPIPARQPKPKRTKRKYTIRKRGFRTKSILTRSKQIRKPRKPSGRTSLPKNYFKKAFRHWNPWFTKVQFGESTIMTNKTLSCRILCSMIL